MMKKYGCLAVILLGAHGTILSMLHTKKIMSGASRLRLNRRTFYDLAFDGKVTESYKSETGLKHLEDAALLRNQSLEDIKKELSDIKIQLEQHDQRLANLKNDLMSECEYEKNQTHKARISYMRQMARIEALGKVYAMPNLDVYHRERLLDAANSIGKE